MERKTLESAAANYAYLQGLYAIPFGILLMLIGVSNLLDDPGPLVLGILGGGVMLSLGAYSLVVRYYKIRYGQVTLTRSRRMKTGVAVAIGLAILIGVQTLLGPRALSWSPDQPVSVAAASWAVFALTYYAATVGVRAHHAIVWGSLLMAGLLPIWGGLGWDERDAVAMFPVGVAVIASGLLDHRLLVRALGSSKSLNLENSNVGA